MNDIPSYKMKVFVAGCVFLVYTVQVLVAKHRGCELSIYEESSKNSPILFHNDTNLEIPTRGTINLKTGERILVACPDNKNYLTIAHTNFTEAKCIPGKLLRVACQDVPFANLTCQKSIKGKVAATNRKCGNNLGRIYRIGYQLSPRQFYTVIEVCYDAKLGSTLYAEHLLQKDIKYAPKSNYRPSFSPDAVTTPATIAYKQAYQKSTFNKLFNSASFPEKYINAKSYLARGHLSPDGDFLYTAMQYTSYYYINVCPQWQAINNANWKRAEVRVRKLADKMQETLTVITGTYGNLTLPGANKEDVEIFLAGDKIPVPKFIWKIVYSRKSKSAVVLVSLNNPFARTVNEKDLLCKDICDQVGWNAAAWTDYSKGFIYCCNYKQFAVEVKTAPKLAVVGVLQGPR